jgi:hypothetical protein
MTVDTHQSLCRVFWTMETLFTKGGEKICKTFMYGKRRSVFLFVGCLKEILRAMEILHWDNLRIQNRIEMAAADIRNTPIYVAPVRDLIRRGCEACAQENGGQFEHPVPCVVPTLRSEYTLK